MYDTSKLFLCKLVFVNLELQKKAITHKKQSSQQTKCTVQYYFFTFVCVWGAGVEVRVCVKNTRVRDTRSVGRFLEFRTPGMLADF